MNAAIYIRVSTEEQARHGLSLDEQQRSLESFAQANNMKVVGVFCDAGISARKPYKKRPALLRLLDECKAGHVDTILFIKLDRWFRNVGQYYAVQDILDKYGVTWQATKEDYETRTASGRLKVNIMLSVAQDEADRTSERIKFINDGKRALGQPTNGKAPFGYEVVERGYRVNPSEREAAADMFASFLKLQSVLALKRHMREAWGVSRAYKNYTLMLQNPIYIGKVHGIENACEALVSVDDFELTQKLLKQRAQRNMSCEPDRVYLFSGLLHCAECGKTMQSETAKKVYRYYRCRTHALEHTCEHTKRVREDDLESFLLRELTSISKKLDAELDLSKERSGKPDNSHIERKLERLKDLYLNELMTLEEYKEEREKLRQMLEHPPEPIRKSSTEEIEKGLAQYPQMSDIEKKEFWTRTVARIEADNNGVFYVWPR